MDSEAAQSERVRTDQAVELIRTQMPETYAAVKRKATEIGNEAYTLVRRGLRGEANCFYAVERGHVVGTPFKQETGIMADVAQLMVQFGCSFLVVWPSGREGGHDGAH